LLAGQEGRQGRFFQLSFRQVGTKGQFPRFRLHEFNSQKVACREVRLAYPLGQRSTRNRGTAAKPPRNAEKSRALPREEKFSGVPRFA
jgi:hypothetical protein